VSLLELVIVVLFVLWITGGFLLPVGGPAVHLLLVIAVILVVFRLLEGRRL
jgi:hypothetical protein